MSETPSVRVGVQVWPQQSTFAQQRDTWLRCEDLGVDVFEATRRARRLVDGRDHAVGG